MKGNPIRTLVFTVPGGVIGLVWGLITAPDGEAFAFLPLVSGLAVGTYLSWFYRDRDTTVNLIIRISIGIALGLIAGVLPGMILGTILSIPFPDSFWSFFYLLGQAAGMFVVSVAIARGLVYLGEQ